MKNGYAHAFDMDLHKHEQKKGEWDRRVQIYQH